jgi:CheY-like chemotaxis protein
MTHTLVIDDDADLRFLLRAALTVAGHEVFEAGDGAAALRLLEGQAVDLVFCDLMMPVMGGLEAIPRIRRELPAARIVAMSSGGGYNVPDLLAAARQLGADVTLEKPFTEGQMHAAAAEALAGE